MAKEEKEKTPAKGGKMGKIIFLFLVLGAAGSGAAAPWLFPSHKTDAHPAKKAEPVEAKPAVIPFGDIIVNLGEERLTRYLRLKVLIVVEEKEAKEITELVTKQKAFLKNWAISYLSDKSVQEVSRAVGVNRIRREMRDQFNALLFPDGSEKVIDILFDEFVVQ